MKVLYVDRNMYGKDDIIKAMRDMGHEVEMTDVILNCDKKESDIGPAMSNFLKDKTYDAVFTTNFSPAISNACNEKNIKYISWTYDSPQILLYRKAVKNPCNYVFTFDSDECTSLRKKGVTHAYYMPLGVNPERLNQIKITQQDRKIFSADVGMVASLYNEDHNLYDRMAPKLSDYAKGYLDSVMQVQKNLFGGFVLEDVLYNPKVLSEMYQAMPYDLEPGDLTNLEYIYANYFLSRKVATLQRLEYIEAISKRFEMKVYTPGDLSKIPTAKAMGTVDYLTDMTKVFRLSKINLNITLPSIHTGIPLRIMDILGAGGFLLTNYQADMFDLFEPDVDFVYYTSLEDALDKIEYYLNHEEERAQIARNAKKKMEECFTYRNLLEQIFEIVEEDSQEI